MCLQRQRQSPRRDCSESPFRQGRKYVNCDLNTVCLFTSLSVAGAAVYLAMSIRLCREVGTQVFSPCTNTTPLSM